MKCLSYEDRELIRRARRDGREAKKKVPLVKQNVMKLEVSRQRIDQKRKKGWGRGRRERIEKGSRERIEKRDKREMN